MDFRLHPPPSSAGYYRQRPRYFLPIIQCNGGGGQILDTEKASFSVLVYRPGQVFLFVFVQILYLQFVLIRTIFVVHSFCKLAKETFCFTYLVDS